MLHFEMLQKGITDEHLGLIPYFLDARDPDSATQQIDKNYQFGGGWQPFHGFTMDEGGVLKYPGDPNLVPLAKAQLRKETIYFYDYARVAVRQEDGSFSVAHID